MQFNSVQAYIEAIRDDPGLAMIPLGLVAELKGISRSAVAEQIKSGTLEAVVVKGRRKTWRGVRPAGLFAQAAKAESALKLRRAAISSALAFIATEERTGIYTEVMAPAGMSPQNPRHRAEIGALLADLSRDSFAAHGFLIGAVVVQKSTGRPNELFFTLARELGALAPGQDENSFWQAECQRVYRHFARVPQTA